MTTGDDDPCFPINESTPWCEEPYYFLKIQCGGLFHPELIEFVGEELIGEALLGKEWVFPNPVYQEPSRYLERVDVTRGKRDERRHAFS